ncbi:hypothetical protein F7725_024714 [Dissostichus mawsoni]|uniref:DNA topoisomerase (ATP-hydrolyzing) n=1 Tax=Dissostichus mawsoni TaxID=36200 RepID=A0A7J5X931_DISMA|nr:hypothetical protein F7725_024714 [Dissostichus mawsoni]
MDAPKKSSSKLSVERVYQKKTQLEHILLRPDTYVGTVEPITQQMWVFDEEIGMNQREITFVPGLYKIFDEILVNAADNKQRDKNMTGIKITIDAESNTISVWNNGKGIPVVEHKDEKMYPKIKFFDGDDFTCVTFQPDLSKFQMEKLDKDIVALLTRRAYDIAGSCGASRSRSTGRNCLYVDLYVKDKVDEMGVALKVVNEKVNDRWEVCLTLSEKGFQQIGFVNCIATTKNPSFDSQTKENMTLQTKSFGSKCVMSEKFVKATQLNKKCSSVKYSKIKGIPKLDDANDAGGKHSAECTLILTEGDSAKSLAVSGLGVIGRDRYGVFPLRGKILNVREATHKQIMENAEINNIIKIVGLQYKKSYEDPESLRSLRYGRIMIMTDQDQDGSHIKGLLINFFHHNWPSLLKHTFLEEFITPIVKVNKSKQELPSTVSLSSTSGRKTQRTLNLAHKVLQRLGTSTSKEAKEYFADMEKHRITFRYSGAEDDAAITLAFSKKKTDDRKEWLTNFMEDRRQRRMHGLPEQYLYGTQARHLSYNDFINKELILFSNSDNERSIPSLVDGLKPGQRKVLFTCMKRNDKREVKVAQLAGSVAEMSAYHHGEQALMMTIVNLAQNFVGSNNVNILQPLGHPLAKLLFPSGDSNLLKFLYDDNQKWYIPIIPMVLVNGAEGIGTGWACKLPNYDPREIVNNIYRLLKHQDPLPMETFLSVSVLLNVISVSSQLPRYKNFKGVIHELGQNQYLMSGEVSVLDRTTIEITELPVRTWTQEYHTDQTVKFVVRMSEEKLAQAESVGLHKVFKLQSTLTCNSMVLFDHMGCMKRYDSVQDILKEFFDLRLQYYKLRKDWLLGKNKSKRELIRMLVQKGFESDPVAAWTKAQEKRSELNNLDKKSPEDLWKEDLAVFIEELDKVEAQEREDDNIGKGVKLVKGKVGKPKAKKLNLEETLPSLYGRRVEPPTQALRSDSAKSCPGRRRWTIHP